MLFCLVVVVLLQNNVQLISLVLTQFALPLRDETPALCRYDLLSGADVLEASNRDQAIRAVDDVLVLGRRNAFELFAVAHHMFMQVLVIIVRSVASFACRVRSAWLLGSLGGNHQLLLEARLLYIRL